jgi:HAD domain in Swiss Army Knife RNA repair proteins
MKVIFLDFDGPILPMLSHSKRKADYEAGNKTPLAAWPPCVAALNRITDTTGAVIVVSSTWRADGIMRTRERLRGWGVKASCIALTPYLDRKTDGGLWAAVPRGLEIQKWLDGYQRETVESFVIIDDDRDMEHLLPRLIHTPFECGLTEADADRAIEMLQAK